MTLVKANILSNVHMISTYLFLNSRLGSQSNDAMFGIMVETLSHRKHFLARALIGLYASLLMTRSLKNNVKE